MKNGKNQCHRAEHALNEVNFPFRLLFNVVMWSVHMQRGNKRAPTTHTHKLIELLTDEILKNGKKETKNVRDASFARFAITTSMFV